MSDTTNNLAPSGYHDSNVFLHNVIKVNHTFQKNHNSGSGNIFYRADFASFCLNVIFQDIYIYITIKT